VDFGRIWHPPPLSDLATLAKQKNRFEKNEVLSLEKLTFYESSSLISYQFDMASSEGTKGQRWEGEGRPARPRERERDARRRERSRRTQGARGKRSRWVLRPPQ
jgi:hypothetical protein